jgi:hypothetical protein
MPMNLSFPTIWNLIDSFKERCLLSGWETCQTEDWVKTDDGKYHNFLWTQTIHPSTFERIVSNHKCGIRRGVSYEVVDVAYTCWLFPERPPELLISQVKENPELKKKTALFDLSCVYTGEKICRKINETESCVFKEFEQFLEEEWNLEFKSVDELATLTT